MMANDVKITRADIDAARDLWRKYAPNGWRNLIEAKAKK